MSNEQYIERYWRDATPADSIAEPPMVARFKDHNDELWRRVGKLVYRDRSEYPWVDENHWTYDYCQVYDAPDAGKGWRLVDVEKDIPQVGDEIYEKPKNRWLYRANDKPYDKELIYRRRIEQPKPEPKYEPFRWEDRGQLRGRWIARNDGNLEVYPTCFFLTESTFFVGTLDVQKIVDHWHFLDTGKPVGRRVQ